jgi:hypothetical protein
MYQMSPSGAAQDEANVRENPNLPLRWASKHVIITLL